MLGGEKNFPKCQNLVSGSFLPSGPPGAQASFLLVAWPESPQKVGASSYRSSLGRGGSEPPLARWHPYLWLQYPSATRVWWDVTLGHSRPAGVFYKTRSRGGEEKTFIWKKKKPKVQVIVKVPAGTPLWALRKIRNWIPTLLSETLQGSRLGPKERPKWSMATYLGFLDRCSQSLAGGHGFVPSAWAWRGCPGKPWPRQASEVSPLDRVLPCVWGLWWPLGPASHSGLVFSLLGPAGLIPGAGWVWEADERQLGFFSWWAVGLE